MPKANVAQTNFSAGEVSPLLRGRVDTEMYAHGVETCENMVIRPQGGPEKRSGSRYIGEVKTSSKKTRVIPFRFSVSEVCLLEFGDFYVRIWKYDSLVDNGANASSPAEEMTKLTQVDNTYSITALTPGVNTAITTGVHAYNGIFTYAYFSGVVGTTELNGVISAVRGTSTTTFTVYTTTTNTWVSGGAVQVIGSTPLELTTPWGENDLAQLYVEQSADILYVAHPNYQTRKISRTSPVTWTIGTYDSIDGPYMSIDPNNITMTLSAVSDTATLTAVSGTPFVAGDVGKYVEWNEGGVWRLALITAFTSTSVVTVDVIDNTLVDFDPNIRLEAKPATDVSRSAQSPSHQGTSNVRPNSSGFRTSQPAGVGSQYRTSGVLREGTDPAATLATGANVTSSHAGTFSRNDVGKYIRVDTRVWRLLTYTVTNTDRNMTAAAAVTFMAASPAPETLVVSSRSITATVTASTATFATTDVGRHIRLNYNGLWVWGKISAYTSATVVTVTLYAEPPTNPINNAQIVNHGRTNIWRFGSWSNTTGWPRTVTFHEQRLVFGGTRTEPQSLWLSRSADFDNHAPTEPDSTVLDDNGIAYTLASAGVNAITWLQSATVLLIGTVGGEWQARAANSIQEPITPTNLSITPQSSYGGIENVRARRVGSAVLFIQLSCRKLIEIYYSFELDSWVGRDLTLASEHILRGSAETACAVETAWCGEPANLLWLRLDDGTLVCVTYIKEQSVLAWHRHTIGGSGIVESICALPSKTRSDQALFMVVQRTINGSTKRYIERIIQGEETYIDSWISVFPTGSTLTGCGHLEAATVEVLATGRLTSLGTFAVSGGSVVVGQTNSGIVGLPFTGTIKFLPPEGGSPYGTAQGKIKRSARTAIRVYDSTSFKHGPATNNMTEVRFADVAEAGSNPFTGDYIFNPNQTFSTEVPYYIQQTKGERLKLLAWLPQYHTNE